MAADTVSAAIPATTTGAMMSELAEKQLHFTEHNDTVQPIEIGIHMYSQEESPTTAGNRAERRAEASRASGKGRPQGVQTKLSRRR